MSKRDKFLILSAILAGLIFYTAINFFIILTIHDKVKVIEKILKGDKYLCSVKHKILNTHINCDQLKNTQEQGN